jgi:hypothetical protein
LPKSEPLLAQKRNTTNFFRTTLRDPANTCRRWLYVAEHHLAVARDSQFLTAASASTQG